jgi:hypothetical protein
MLAFLFTDLTVFLSHPLGWLFMGFNLWMLVDAFRREEWMWVAFIILFPLLNGVLYFFMVYRASASLPSAGFALPGQADRERIAELEKQIQLLDKAHHHSELGDVYFQQSKFKQAEACYLRALERDPQDIDTRSHLGQCLLWLGRASEARGYLESVCLENPKHDYGNSLMALAEARAVLGDTDGAISVWEQVVTQHSHSRARVQLAELLAAKGQGDRARQLVEEVISEDKVAPEYQRKQEQQWVARAKKLAKGLAK